MRMYLASDLPPAPLVQLSRRRLLLTPLLAGMAAAAQAQPAQPGQAVVWPELTLLDGRRLGAGHWRDHAAVVVFWTTTCPFCRRHNQHVEKLHRAAAGLPLTVLGVARENSATTVQRYAQQQGYSFPITLNHGALAAALSQRNLVPLTVLVGRDGRLKQVLPGEMFEEDVMEFLDLAKKAA
jgi:thiol-disulfide isomerase/thioredoxin